MIPNKPPDARPRDGAGAHARAAGSIVSQRNEADFLNGMRGVAALLVYWHHHELWLHTTGRNIFERAFGYRDRYYFIALPWVRILFNGGHFATAIFFIISSYSMSIRPLRLIRAREEGRENGVLAEHLASSIFRRGFRLYIPVSITTFVFITAIHLFRPPSRYTVIQDSWFRELQAGFSELMDFSFIFSRVGSPWLSYNDHLWYIPIEYKGSMITYISDGWYCAYSIAGILLCEVEMVFKEAQFPGTSHPSNPTRKSSMPVLGDPLYGLTERFGKEFLAGCSVYGLEIQLLVGQLVMLPLTLYTAGIIDRLLRYGIGCDLKMGTYGNREYRGINHGQIGYRFHLEVGINHVTHSHSTHRVKPITGPGVDDRLDFRSGFLTDEHDIDLKAQVWAYKKQREVVQRMRVHRSEIPDRYPSFLAGSSAAYPTIRTEDESRPNAENVKDNKYSTKDDQIIEEWIRKNLTTCWHGLGTCEMAPRERLGVVDKNLCAYGVSGLRIADLSIVPENVCANTMSTVLAVAEKAADIFIDELGLRQR
ncbi:hypothetical protein SCUP515_10874 [Seiridium cupressi]